MTSREVFFNGMPIGDAQRIYDRLADAQLSGHVPERLGLIMDLMCMGVNGNPALDVDHLISAPLGTFVHDVMGIHHHLNRTTGQLEDCFVPRCAI